MPKKGTRHLRELGNATSTQQQLQPPPPGAAAAAAAVTTTTTTLSVSELSELSEVVPAKHLRSVHCVHIGLTNSKRWLSLRRRLGFTADDDVAVYLLDLAESTTTAAATTVTTTATTTTTTTTTRLTR